MPTDDLDPATETALAKRLYNGVWALLEKADRTPEEDAAMIHLAHASRHHWGSVGTPQNLAIGEWQVARVYAELGRGEPAVYHSERARAISEGAEIEDWCRASVLESLARSYAVAGDRATASDYRDRAVAAVATIADPEEREIIARDVESLPL